MTARLHRAAVVAAYLAVTWTIAGLEWLHRSDGWRYR